MVTDFLPSRRRSSSSWSLAMPRIVLVQGMYGAGKTAFASALGLTLAQRLVCTVWANYGLTGAVRLASWEDVTGCCDGVVVLDEFHDVLNARRSTSNQNLEVMRWGGQVRKRGCHLLLVTQMEGKVDLQLRLMVNVIYSLQNIGDPDMGDYRSLVTVHERDHASGRLRRVGQFVWDRSSTFDLYDHREVVEPLAAALSTAEQAAVRRAK